MGRLTIKEVDDLTKAGVLDTKAVEELEKKNLVGTRNHGAKYYLKNGKGKVYPQLYFKGLGKVYVTGNCKHRRGRAMQGHGRIA